MNRLLSLQMLLCVICPFAAVAQHAVLLDPVDAIELAERSDLFKQHYAKGGCPRADAALGERYGEIRLGIEDGCLGAVSGWAGDFIVDRMTGEIRDGSSNQRALASDDGTVVTLWNEINSELMNDSEVMCLVTRSADVQQWQRLGIEMNERVRPQNRTPRDEIVDVEVSPASSAPAAPARALRFEVDRRNYRLFEGRFSSEELSADVVSMSNLLRQAKRPAELTAQEVRDGVRQIPEVAKWLSAGNCRDVRLDPDEEGVTYFAVDLFEWCLGQKTSTGLAALSVDKRSGQILAPQGIMIATRRLPNAQSLLSARIGLRSAAADRLHVTCLDKK